MSGKTVLVTGGAKGLGAWVTRCFVKQGAQLLVLGRDLASLDEIKRECAQLDGRGSVVGIFGCDMGQMEEIEATCAQIQAQGHEVDVLVNNAGIAKAAAFELADMELWERAMRVNAQGPALLSAKLLVGMKARGFGRIINIGSVLSLQGARAVSSYTASKHALLGWSRALALELAGTGVTVNTLCPAYMDTAIFAAAQQAILPRFDQNLEKATGALLKSLDQRRLLSPQEVAQWVLRVAQDGGSLNGQAIRLAP